MRTHQEEALASAKSGSAASVNLSKPETTFDESAGDPTARKWLVMAVVGVGGFMAALNSASLIIILPTLQADLHTDLINILWVMLAYVLASAVLLLSVGRLADLIGNKRIYVLGYLIFGLGSTLCALAGNVWVLIAARFVQGIGGALLMANTSAIITHTFPKRELGRALGIASATFSVGTTLGPIVGGLLTDAINWHWAFWFNVPFAAIGLVLAALYLHSEIGARQNTGREGFDWIGAVLLAISLSALLYFVSLGPLYGWSSARMLGTLAIFLVTAALFIGRQLVAPAPLLHLRLFQHRLFTMANLSAALASMGMIAVLFLMPFYLEDVLHYSLFLSAVLLTPYPLTMLIVAPISGWLSDRLGSRTLGTIGMALSALSLLWMSTLGIHSTYGDVAVRLVVLGLGMGLFQSPNNSAVMSSAPSTRRGIASAVLGTMRNLGTMLGIGITGAVFVSFMPYNAFLQLALTGETTQSGVDAVIAAFRICYWAATLFAVLGIITSLSRGKSLPQTAHQAA
ncbi:MAG TPA: MFS transporter [Ktedonobacterales bacterium]|jgi:EmrB/QacA subfamily drug resistance transporter